MEFFINPEDATIKTRLVIFPMPGNNTFEASDFADPRFSFCSSEGTLLSLTVFLWKKLLRNNMKQMISCSLSKEFVFSRLLTRGEKRANS